MVLALVHHLAVHGSAGGHFDDLVIHIAGDAGLFGQLQPHRGVHIARHGAIEHHIRHPHIAFDIAGLADRQHRVLVRGGNDLALDAAIDMQAAGKTDIAQQFGLLADQSVNAIGGHRLSLGWFDGGRRCGLLG